MGNPSEQSLISDKVVTDDKLQLQDQVARLLSQVKLLTERNVALEKALSEIQSSKSWQLTDPLRRAALYARMVLPLYRSEVVRFSCEAGDNLRVGPKGMEVIGQSPTVLLRASKLLRASNRIPGGWVLLEFSAVVTRGLSFYLHFRTGAGFSSHERHLVTVLESGRQQVLLKLPQGVHELRLDPFEAKEPFSISDVQVHGLGTLQLAALLTKRHAKQAFKDPKAFFRRIGKAWLLFRDGGLPALRARLLTREYAPDYQEWVERYDTLNDLDRQRIRTHLSKLSYQPLISVVMPVYNTPIQWLKLAVQSVQNQLYANWELCIADDASTRPEVAEFLRELEQQDSRVKVCFRKKNGHISECSNSALELATGEFVALLDHDDELREHALYMMVCELNRHPQADMLYSDEDKMNEAGVRLNPYFKCDWNPDLFLQQNYICHLGLYRRKVLTQIGGFRKGFEGAQDWDLAWRVAEVVGAERIRHVPHVLYHWRLIEGSTAASSAFKPYALEAQQKTVKDHLARCGFTDAQVSVLEHISHLRVQFPLPETLPLVSFIIPTRDQVAVLKVAIESVLRNKVLRQYEIIVVDNGSVEPETAQYFKQLSDFPQVRILPDAAPFNYSRLNNKAVQQARGQVLAFLNNDIEATDDGWIIEMLSLLLRPGVGAVGARLWYPSGLLQHAGVILGIGGVAGHNHKGIERHNPGYWNRAILTQELSAVTAACMFVKREAFDAAGGFDEDTLAVAFNDVDLCLKIRKRGYSIVYTPYAELIHHESVSRGYETTPEKFNRFEAEISAMKERWSAELKNDPYYNPNLTLVTEDFALAFPPRAEKPWKAIAG
jgi:glycosyltransferase involved in cell wall biosynthesis